MEIQVFFADAFQKLTGEQTCLGAVSGSAENYIYETNLNLCSEAMKDL